MSQREISIFISYSHHDNKWFKQDDPLFDLIPFLERSLEKRNVTFWYDRHKKIGIEAGEAFRAKIADQIDNSDIALLLISQEFINSTFIAEVELPRIQKRFEDKEMQVFPVLLEPCDYDEIEFVSSLQLVPGKPTPLLEFTDSEKEWKNVRHEILKSLKQKINRISHGGEQGTGISAPINETHSRKKKTWIVWISLILLAVLIPVVFFIVKNKSKPSSTSADNDSVEVTGPIIVDPGIMETEESDSEIPDEIEQTVNIPENETNDFPDGSDQGSFADSRDGKSYQWVRLGNQIWMGENLDFETVTESWCYNNSEQYCRKYGRLYNWKTAQTVCPSGWHLPDDGDWTVLMEYMGGEAVAGKMMKTGNSDDEIGFHAMLGGYRGCYGHAACEQSHNLRKLGYWWSATEYNEEKASYWFIRSDRSQLYHHLQETKATGVSVRCLKD